MTGALGSVGVCLALNLALACSPAPIGSADAGSSDSGSSDAGSFDTGVDGASDAGETDAASGSDGGTLRDAATMEDSGVDAGHDSGVDSSFDAPPSPPVRCEAFGGEILVCDSSETSCGIVFESGEGCNAACASAGLMCLEAFENADDACAADRMRPALGCEETGHRSDYCVCGRGMCIPHTCDSLGACGRVSDGCGGELECGDTCGAGESCVAGFCRGEALCDEDDCPAFPGAEGEGRNAEGGRGGDVCHVTNTSDRGTGSLRDCMEGGSGARTVVFDIGGTIDLQSAIRSRRSRLTLAGQTAPGDGIVIRGYDVQIAGNHNIIQHLRFRSGDIRKARRDRDGHTEDSLTIDGNNIIVDHVSASWGIDECLSTASSDHSNITVQWSIISEGLHRTELFHGEWDPDHRGHSMGSLFKSRGGHSDLSIHHNLFAHNGNRNPAIGGYDDREDSQNADIRNNVLYNCRSFGYVSGETSQILLNYVGNYAIAGEDTTDRGMFDASDAANLSAYFTGNMLDRNENGRFDGSSVDGVGGDFRRVSSPHPMHEITTQSAPEALESVLMSAGARPWNRDSVDERVTQDVRDGTGRIVDSVSEAGGYPEIRGGTRITDSDRDGMPDAFERRAGTNPSRADNNGDIDGDGYTNLENYLHYASENGPLD